MKKKPAWTVYILRCADGSLYTGITRDIARRVDEHNSSRLLAARYTRSRRPVALVYQEKAVTRSAACKREYRIKQLARSEKQALVAKSKGESRKAKVVFARHSSLITHHPSPISRQSSAVLAPRISSRGRRAKAR